MNFSFWKRFRRFFLSASAGLFFLVLGISSAAGSDRNEFQVPEAVSDSLQYFIDVINNSSSEYISKSHIAPIIDFILSDKQPHPAIYYSSDNSEGKSVYHEFDIDQEFPKILDYAYSLEIPSQAVIPNSLRLSFWKKCNGDNRCRPWSWNYPPSEGRFQVIRGVQHETTTPDMFSWTYYNYDLERVLILSRYKDHNVFFSISRQKEKAPGKKAFTLGDDQDWNYLYTRETGVNKAGLGWVTPYMYSSYSITVFVEQPDRRKTKCAMFKWLNAGAVNINMVQKHHIYEGMKRFETGIKSVLENPDLPELKTLVSAFSVLENLSLQNLRKEALRYFNNLQKRYHDEKVFQDEKLAELITSSEYVNQLTSEEMKAILRLEYLKTVLGKDPLINLEHIFPDSTTFLESP